MQSTATRSAKTAKILILTLLGAGIGIFYFKSINATLTGAVIGFTISIIWQ